MFKTIQGEGGGNGPEWLSSHPDPGNRYLAILKESQSLRIADAAPPSDEFKNVQARLASMPPAYTAAQIAQMQKTGTLANAPGTAGAAGRTVQVPTPSGQYSTYRAGNLLRISVPSNWVARGGKDAITYAPDGAYYERQGGSAFTHGIELGLTQGTGNLARDTSELLKVFGRSNPQLRQEATAKDTVGGRAGFTTTLSNVSEVTGQNELVELSTTQLRDGQVLYVIGVAPRQDGQTYAAAFRRIRQNLQISDR